ncbi:MAG: hypothetical protein IT449_16615 [Phycisphaerales bacterium]|nr:hypothetical protein [Phycisphaerales bacterium]
MRHLRATPASCMERPYPARTPETARRTACLALAWLLTVLTAAAPAPGVLGEDRADLFALVPADAVAVVALDPPRSASPVSSPSTDDLAAQLLVQISRQLGMFLEADETLRVWTDVAASFVQLVRRPVAFALLDIEFEQREDGGHELARLDAALWVDTQGNHETVEQQIRHLLNTYTNQEHTKLQRIDGAGARYELKDDRLPGWASITFGPVGAAYVITLGEGAAQRVARCANQPDSTLAHDAWLTAAARACRGPGIEFRFYAGIERLAQRQPDGFHSRLSTWLNLIDLPAARKLYVVIRRDGRVVESTAFVRQADSDRAISIADHEFLKPWGYDLIPKEATVFTVADVHFRTLPLSVWEAFVTSRTPNTAARFREARARIEAESGVRLREDVFARLGDRIVIHDFPVHALRLPVARTIYVPIEKEPELVADKLDRFLAAAARALVDPSTGAPSSLRREPDGVWYVHLGLQGPAVKVCGNWLVISYSPFAVRENERHLQEAWR